MQLAAAAVGAVARHIARTHSPSGHLPAAVLGHSLGGKIALRYLRDAAAATAAADATTGSALSLSTPSQTWSLDSVPTALGPDDDPHDVQRVINVIRSLPREFDSREAFAEVLAAHEMGKKFPRDLVVRWRGTLRCSQYPRDLFGKKTKKPDEQNLGTKIKNTIVAFIYAMYICIFSSSK